MVYSGVARTFGAHGHRTLRGPSPYFITLSLWPLPHIHPYSDFAHVYLYYMILNTTLFNQYISYGVFWKFGSLWWRDGGKGGPWWHNDKWDHLITWCEIRGHNGVPSMTQWWKMNWDPLITWWEGHHFDDMMKKIGGPWLRNGTFRARCPLMTQWGNWKPLIKQWGNCGELNDLMRKTGNWAPDDAMEH